MRAQDIPRHIPASCGIYFFKKNSTIIYIGKATTLSTRIKSYFSNDLDEKRGPKIVAMVHEADTIDWQVTDSVLEALVTESALIKKYHPVYNTREKDNKSYNYVVITDEPMPRVFTIRERELHMYGEKLPFIPKKTFGPFPHGNQLREALRLLRKIFPFRDKKARDPRHERLYTSIGLSPATNTTFYQTEYLHTIKNLVRFFEGNKTKIITNLERRMRAHARAKEFEQADILKRQLFALQHIQDVSLLSHEDEVFDTQGFRIEAYDVAHIAGTHTVGVMVVHDHHELQKSDYKKFNIKNENYGSDTHALQEILERRFAHTEWEYPKLMVIDGGKAQKNIAERFLKKQGITIPVVAVTKDEHHKAREVLGDKKIIQQYEREILLANNESHRFALASHKKLRHKNLFD